MGHRHSADKKWGGRGAEELFWFKPEGSRSQRLEEGPRDPGNSLCKALSVKGLDLEEEGVGVCLGHEGHMPTFALSPQEAPGTVLPGQCP